MNNWICAKDKSNLKKDHPYLLYGEQLCSHFPGKTIGRWNGENWQEWDDKEYYFRESEVDFYLDILEINTPIGTRET